MVVRRGNFYEEVWAEPMIRIAAVTVLHRVSWPGFASVWRSRDLLAEQSRRGESRL